MPRHAILDATTPYMVPAYPLTPETHDYPLALLADYGQPLPVAHGVEVHPATRDIFHADCDGCGERGCDAVVEHGDGPATPYHLACIVTGDHFGLIPTCYVELIGYHDPV